MLTMREGPRAKSRCWQRRPPLKALRATRALPIAEKIIARLLKMLIHLGHLVEEEGVRYIADMDADNSLASLQAASCTYRIALGPRTGQKVLSLRTVAGRDAKISAGLCADEHGFSLHAGLRCGTHQRRELERLCRYITRAAIADEWQLWRKSNVSCGSIADLACQIRLQFLPVISTPQWFSETPPSPRGA